MNQRYWLILTVDMSTVRYWVMHFSSSNVCDKSCSSQFWTGVNIRSFQKCIVEGDDCGKIMFCTWTQWACTLESSRYLCFLSPLNDFQLSYRTLLILFVLKRQIRIKLKKSGFRPRKLGLLWRDNIFETWLTFAFNQSLDFLFREF